MSLYQNPLNNPEHALYARHSLAWEAKRNGKPMRALRLWQEMLDQEQLAADSPECVEIQRQMAVCLRLVWRLQAADELFAQSYERALRIDDQLARAVLFDWSAVSLDRGKPDDAIALLDPIYQVFEVEHPAYYPVKAYLGRAYSRKLSGASRRKGRSFMKETIEHLEGDLKFDVEAWLLEDRFWRGRRKHYLRLREVARRDYPTRHMDIVIRYVGGWWLHYQLRRVVSLGYRFAR